MQDVVPSVAAARKRRDLLLLLVALAGCWPAGWSQPKAAKTGKGGSGEEGAKEGVPAAGKKGDDQPGALGADDTSKQDELLPAEDRRFLHELLFAHGLAAMPRRAQQLVGLCAAGKPSAMLDRARRWLKLFDGLRERDGGAASSAAGSQEEPSTETGAIAAAASRSVAVACVRLLL